MNINDKNWTGERLETFVLGTSVTEHLHRYALVKDLCIGKTVVDIACGEGYGSNIIAKKAHNVIGVDIDEETIKAAKKKYQSNNINFLVGSCTSIPVDDNIADFVISFETLEHHSQHEEMMEEIKRVLKPEGVLVISTPDKQNYSDKTNYRNPYHTKELYFLDFKNLLETYFQNCDFYLQKVVDGSLIISTKKSLGFKQYNGDYTDVYAEENFEAMYNIGIASNFINPVLSTSFFSNKSVLHEIIEDTIFRMKQSNSYKIGHAVLYPARQLRRLINWFR